MSADRFRALAALGLSMDQIAGVLEIMDAENEERRAKGRDRWHKWKSKQPTVANVSQREQTTANDSSQLVRDPARVEDNLQTKKISGKEEKEVSAPAAPTSLSELCVVLDIEHARAVIEHRSKLRKPLTPYAAKRLALKLAQCPDANAAADAIIEAGWSGFEPEWLENRKAPQQRSTPPPSPRLTQSESLRNMARERGIIDATGTPTGRLEAGDRDGENPGVGDVIRLAVKGNHRW